MSKLIDSLLTARILSAALVLEVGFIIGVYVGRTEHLSPFQWGGAALAMLSAVAMAAIVYGWPTAPATKAAAERARQER